MDPKNDPRNGQRTWTLCRFRLGAEVRVGLKVDAGSVRDLTSAGIASIEELLEDEHCGERLEELSGKELRSSQLAEISLCTPVERQEVWAAGVTYLRSKTARMDESDFSATAYD